MNALALALVLVMQPWGSQLDGEQRVVIIGLPTCGKSWHAERLTHDAHRVVFASPNPDDYARDGRLLLSVAELERYPALLDDPHTRVSVQLEGDDSKQLADEVHALSALALDAGDLVLVLDEVGDYRQHAERHLNRLFRRGRHFGVSTILVSQVATDIPLTCRRTATRVLCLAQRHTAELAALRETYGPEFAERASRWRKYEPPIEWSAAVEAA